jgi:lactoylglutathione lyase
MKAVYKNAWGYQGDAMNLPVADAEAAAPFYEKVFGFSAEPSADADSPVKKVDLVRDNIRIALAENGGDPGQDGCAFEVDDVAAAHAELKSNGLEKIGEIKAEKREDGSEWKAFFVIAPDGLCFWVGQKI